MSQLSRLEARIREAVASGELLGAFLINSSGSVAVGAGQLRTEVVLVPEARHFLNGLASTTSRSGELLVFLQLHVRNGPELTLLGVFKAGTPVGIAATVVDAIFRGAAEPN